MLAAERLAQFYSSTGTRLLYRLEKFLDDPNEKFLQAVETESGDKSKRTVTFASSLQNYVDGRQLRKSCTVGVLHGNLRPPGSKTKENQRKTKESLRKTMENRRKPKIARVPSASPV